MKRAELESPNRLGMMQPFCHAQLMLCASMREAYEALEFSGVWTSQMLVTHMGALLAGHEELAWPSLLTSLREIRVPLACQMSGEQRHTRQKDVWKQLHLP